MSIVSTGQITIVDNNDAKPITIMISGSQPANQIFTKDESAVSYIPDFTVSNQVLTPKVFVAGAAGAVDILPFLTSKKWSASQGGASIASTSTLTINTNMTTASPTATYYFEADYTDPVTGLTVHLIATYQMSLLTTGTNAVYIQVTGQDVIEQSTSITKNTAILKADLIRASGIDDTGISYQWYEMPGKVPITQATANYALKYGFRTTAQANAGSGSALGTGVPASASYTDSKGIIIGEPAINNIGIYMVECKDSDSKIYQNTFTVYDISDIYTTRVNSTNGDKLQNGVGSTDLTPQVFYGSVPIADLSNWTFVWSYFDSTGTQGGFIDTTRTSVSGGRNITANTAGAAAVVTFDGAAITLANNDMVKLVTPAGAAFYFELASGSGNTATLRVPATTSTFLAQVAPTASQFVGGKFFVCTGNGTTAGTRTTLGGALSTAAKITVTGDEIDVKGTIQVKSNRP